MVTMWSSSNMFLKKLIANLCSFPRSTFTANNKPPRPVPPAFHTHLSRHLSTYCNDHQTGGEEEPPENEKKKMTVENLHPGLGASTSKSTTPDDNNDGDDEDVFFTSSSNTDFATVFASQRFFFSSPGHSKSLVDQSSTTLGGVPVPKDSPDPYWDFRRSMQEMVEARGLVRQSSKGMDRPGENDWEYLHQLLTCYLSLNPVNTHECIIKAFSDLLLYLLLDNKPDKVATATVYSARPNHGRSRSVSRRLL